MNTTKGMHQLSEMFKSKPWFHDVGVDQYGRLVVYVKYNCEETIRHIPDEVEGTQVLVHLAGSATARREDFITSPEPKRLMIQNPDYMVVKREVTKPEEDDMDLPPELVNHDLEELTKELDRLERLCDSNTLQDIFYEVHDGSHAVTDLGSRFGLVKASMERLYKEYGFDVIYEELDG